MQPRTSVGRRAPGLLLAALLLLTTIMPSGVSGADPSPLPAPAADPSTEPDPSAPPSIDPSAEPSAEPSLAPEPSASAEPSAPPDPSPSAEPSPTPDLSATGGLDPTGRYIVVVDNDAAVSTVLNRQRSEGVQAMRQFRTAVDGFVAKLDDEQVAALEADPAVEAVVPDELISIEQDIPTGIRRVFATSNPIANINGVDDRVDADIAIVDTGIDGSHPDLNVAGGINCSTTNQAAWRDVHGHGTHVAGIAAARDDAWGVVGVAPGARLWAVKILNDSGFGYLSWYVCGLDWIAAQKDPANPARPLFEVANMSVAKSGHDDRNCGATENDVMHAAVCRVVAAGVTVVAAAGNETTSAAAYVPAAYNEVITVSALADTDGKPGGQGGNYCSSFGGYDKDDTLADFSNAGSDVDLIAPGKCIKSTLPGGGYGLMSGTSMATPHVSGAVALYKESRPNATAGEVRSALVYLGNFGWSLGSDRDSYHEPLLDVSRLGRLGTFTIGAGTPPPVGGQAGTVGIPVTLSRSSTFFERVRLSAQVPAGWSATFDSSSLFGFTANSTTLRVTRPAGTHFGTYPVRIVGSYYSMTDDVTVNVRVEDVPPVASPPVVNFKTGSALGRYDRATPTLVSWSPAKDVTSLIDSYEISEMVGGSVNGTWTLPGTTTALARNHVPGTTFAYELTATDAAGNVSDAATSRTSSVSIMEDTSSSIQRSSGHWKTIAYAYATSQRMTYASKQGAWMKFPIAAGTRQVGLVAPKGPYRGKAKIYVDGVYLKTIDLYAKDGASRVLVYARNVDPATAHTLTIKLLGTPGRPRVDVDALVSLR